MEGYINTSALNMLDIFLSPWVGRPSHLQYSLLSSTTEIGS